jgi:uncharacterized protein (TIGR00730 family)
MNKDEITKFDKYEISHEDKDFFYSDEARGLRLEVDYLKAEVKMQQEGIIKTIVVFGSARTQEDNPLYMEARKFGRLVSESGQGPEDCHVTLMTGGGPGIMEAANRGAHDVGAKSIGLNIKLPHEQSPNPYISPDLSFQFYYFGIRKLHFMQRAKALVVFPGGFGTLDELFDILTLIQTGKSPLIPIVLVSKKYWSNVINFEYLVKENVIDNDNLNLFSYAEEAKEAWDSILSWYEKRGITLF